MKVSIITPTTGNHFLEQCIESVRNQTHKDVEHLIVVDGQERLEASSETIDRCKFGSRQNEHLLVLPYATGTNRYNGHRIYGGTTYFADGDYHLWLDDDNIIEPTHVESLVKLVQENNLDWAYSLRKIIDKEGNILCNDDCESLGMWPSILHEQDFFIDVNCYFVKKEIAVQLSPVWYRKFREAGQMEIDRAIAAVLMNKNNKLKFDCTRDYTVQYRVGNTGLSVQAEFFINGNKKILERYNNNLPWNKK